MYQIQLPMTYFWHTQTLSVSYSYSASTNQLLLLLSCTAPPPHVQLKHSVILLVEIKHLFYPYLLLYSMLLCLMILIFLDINWTNPYMSCQYAIPLILLSDCLFLNQQVLEPTRKSTILDQIFSPDDFINSIDVTDSVLSDHPIITAKTYNPFCHSPPICKSTNRICNAFEPLDFRKADWSGLCSSIKLVN